MARDEPRLADLEALRALLAVGAVDATHPARRAVLATKRGRRPPAAAGEALRGPLGRLRRAGLVEVVKGKGWYVTPRGHAHLRLTGPLIVRVVDE